jgi:hypothetical protein
MVSSVTKTSNECGRNRHPMCFPRIFELHRNDIGGGFAIALGDGLKCLIQCAGWPLVGEGRDATFLWPVRQGPVASCWNGLVTLLTGGCR